MTTALILLLALCVAMLANAIYMLVTFDSQIEKARETGRENARRWIAESEARAARKGGAA